MFELHNLINALRNTSAAVACIGKLITDLGLINLSLGNLLSQPLGVEITPNMSVQVGHVVHCVLMICVEPFGEVGN